ncbi:MAG: DUF58 domain-containing protein [Anaerolineales bacterium]
MIVIAALMRDDFVLTSVYFFLGAIFLGLWWSRRSLSQVHKKREVIDHAFLGEKIKVRIQIHNQGWFPLPWLSVQDKLPVGLSTAPSFQRVISLAPHRKADFEYTVEARKRGYYPLGPLVLSTGDLLGVHKTVTTQEDVRYLTIYPKIVPLSSIEIPSFSPQGTLRHHQPIFEDPSRVFGKREYVAGDSLRRVDWKSTASTGRLQVKLFEPSIALETLICLNLNEDDYYYRRRIDSTELAIVIAASIANWIVEKQQTVGLLVNGRDPLKSDGEPQYLPPRKGKSHLMRVLEVMARIDTTKGSSLIEKIRRRRHFLAWGTTLIVITGGADDELLQELYQARRSGQNAILVLVGPVAYAADIKNRASRYGIQTVSILNERGLDIWRK